MSVSSQHDSDPLGAFVASTRSLAVLLDEFDPDAFDPDAFDRGIQRQLEAFKVLQSAASMGTLGQSAAVASAIEEARRTLGVVSGRQHEIREELDGLRVARTRTLRRLGTDATAQFVSRRV